MEREELTSQEQDRQDEIQLFFGENRKKAVEAMLKIAVDYLDTELVTSKSEEANLADMIYELITETCYKQQECLRSEALADIEGEYVGEWVKNRKAAQTNSWALDCVLEGLKP